MARVIALLVGLAFLVPSVSMAAPTEGAREVWVVDIQKVINDSAMGRASRNIVEAEAKKREGKIKALNTELEKNRSEYEKQVGVLAPDALQIRREALIKREREVAREVQDAQEDLQRKNSVEITKLLGEVKKIVAELATKKNRPLILERDARMVLYVDPEFDLTAEVIKMLNDRTPSK